MVISYSRRAFAVLTLPRSPSRLSPSHRTHSLSLPIPHALSSPLLSSPLLSSPLLSRPVSAAAADWSGGRGQNVNTERRRPPLGWAPAEVKDWCRDASRSSWPSGHPRLMADRERTARRTDGGLKIPGQAMPAQVLSGSVWPAMPYAALKRY